MADKIEIDDDDDFSYNVTDSEEDYSENEKELLQEIGQSQRKQQSPVEDILAFTESESASEGEGDNNDNFDDEDDNEDFIDGKEDSEDIADSDIERTRDSDINDDETNTKYWGKKKRNYYNTDFVDQDYSSYNAKEEELAKMEEEEANNIRLRLVKELKEEDFLLDTLSNKENKHVSMDISVREMSPFINETLSSNIQLKTDFSKLTKKERLQLFEKDAPEFAALVGDLENYLNEIHTIHSPVLEYCHQNNVPMIPALKFAQHYQNIALTYCNNIMFYLLLKSAGTASVQYHPVIKRLNQLKKLLNQLDDKHENIIKPQLEALLERIVDGDNFKVLEQTNNKQIIKNETNVTRGKVQFIQKSKRINEYDDGKADVNYDDGLDEDDIDVENSLDGNDVAASMENDDDHTDSAMRRNITYEIAKNKGLMPHRKKEQRNPRVKHRGKYRKALIRRKGAVRNVCKEIKRYGGEISGIKATVSKSIKFKT